MCHPAVMAAAQVVSGVLEYDAEKQAVKAHNQQVQRNNILALQARDLKVRQVDNETEQNLMNAAQEKLESKIETMKAEAKAQVAGSAAGISGRALEVITEDFVRQGLRADTATSTEMDRYIDAAVLRRQGLASEAQGRLQTKKSKPSAMMALVKTGVSAATAYHTFGGEFVKAKDVVKKPTP